MLPGTRHREEGAVSWFWDASLLAGPAPAVISLIGALSLLLLLVWPEPKPRPDWWRRVVPLSAAGSVLLVALADLVLELWRPFPDQLPARVLAWAAIGLWAVLLAVARARRSGRRAPGWRRCCAVGLAALLVLTLAAMKINAFYGYRPSIGAALGRSPADEVDFSALAGTRPTPPTNPGRSLIESWQPPPDMPRTGRVTHVDIAGTHSGFRARPASIYLPPAYLGSARPLLPVLVLIAGQPGGPEDWLVAGKLSAILDAFASTHAGLAPVVVVADATGSSFANSLCLDSKLARAETYLADDVPAWIVGNLQIDHAAAHWAIGGFSFGGTCALQLAVRRPSVFPTFLDISGQQEPTLGSHDKTVWSAFGGDEGAFHAVNPLDILAAQRFTPTEGVLAVGTDDHEYGPQCLRVADASRAAGMSIQLLRPPGGHSWAVAADSLRAALPILATRARLIPPP
ncbi:MAG TPA: alpha/beta hydrolase-fold protein [Pseudonocardia sp.]|nr:alpha/beta hydrolase-fold protein [Pseudonocardia sp.]